MSDEHKTIRLIVIFSILCVLLSIIFGILARIGFWTLFFRSILFALIGSFSAFVISKVWNKVIGDTLSTDTHTHKDDEDVDEFFGPTEQDDEVMGGDTTTRIESPNALYQAQSYKDDSSDFATEDANLEEKIQRSDFTSSQDSFENSMDGTSQDSESMAQEDHELDRTDTKIISNTTHEDITNSNENSEEIDNTTDENENNNVAEDAEDDTFQEDKFQDYKTNPAPTPTSQDAGTSISSNTLSTPTSQSAMKNEYSASFDDLEDYRYGIKTTGHAKYDAAIKKTVDVYNKTPEKVTKAVATWLENGNNSK